MRSSSLHDRWKCISLYRARRGQGYCVLKNLFLSRGHLARKIESCVISRLHTNKICLVVASQNNGDKLFLDIENLISLLSSSLLTILFKNQTEKAFSLIGCAKSDKSYKWCRLTSYSSALSSRSNYNITMIKIILNYNFSKGQDNKTTRQKN